MMTREELLAMASDALESWDRREGELGTSKAAFALACVALAKELPSVKGEVVANDGKWTLRFEETGEVRPPKEGEWFVGRGGTPVFSPIDFEFNSCKILRVVDA